jgi:hypothetical protein
MLGNANLMAKPVQEREKFAFEYKNDKKEDVDVEILFIVKVWWKKW